MSLASADKIIHYVGCASRQDLDFSMAGNRVHYQGAAYAVISPSILYRDGCEGCGRCCPNWDFAYSGGELDHIRSIQGHHIYISENEYSEHRKSHLESLTEVPVVVNGVDKLMYQVDKQSAAHNHGIMVRDGKALGCRYVRKIDDRYTCVIHPIRSITCGVPHMSIRRSGDSLRIGEMQFGRNHMLKCPVVLDGVTDDLSTRVYWLKRIQMTSEYFNIDTWLPEVIKTLEQPIDKLVQQLSSGPIYIKKNRQKRLF